MLILLYGRTDRLTVDNPEQCSFGEHVEHDNGDAVFAAHGYRRGIHDLEPTGKHFVEGDGVKPDRIGIMNRIAIVDTVNLGAFEDDIRIDLSGSERCVPNQSGRA